MDMYQAVMQWLGDQRKNKRLLAISRDTGLEYSWLRRLSQGVYHDPGVKKIQTLYHYMNSRRA